MATGNSAGFWDEEQSPALLKHEILARYVAPFVAKLGLAWGKVVLLDGYAGAGRYASGAPGSAIQIVSIAGALVTKLGISADVYLIERESETIDFLRKEVARFGKTPRLNIFIIEGDVAEKFDEIVSSAAKFPLFIFLDPYGLGLPYEKLSHALSVLRPPSGRNSAPTEILLNFSAEALRRIGGLVPLTPSPTSIATLDRMDKTVGGEWWRDFYKGKFDKELAETNVVDGYTERLGKSGKMYTHAVPVRRDVGLRPVYYLVFGTRAKHGSWTFADTVARSEAKWQNVLEERKDTGQLSFDGFGVTAEERLVALEEKAVVAIETNLLEILATRGEFMVGDYPTEVFGEYLGLVREQVVRKAIKSLFEQGRISSNGQGSPIYKLLVSPRS